MGELRLYKCDRCGKEFSLPKEDQVVLICRRERNYCEDNKWETLCDGCDSVIFYVFDQKLRRRVDKFIDSIFEDAL